MTTIHVSPATHFVSLHRVLSAKGKYRFAPGVYEIHTQAEGNGDDLITYKLVAGTGARQYATYADAERYAKAMAELLAIPYRDLERII